MRIGVAGTDKPDGPFKPMATPIEGVKGIDPGVFIGHDGSVYVAATGPLHGGYGFGRQYQLVCTEVERRLSLYFTGPAAGLSPKVAIRMILAHLVASALEQASVIQYRAFSLRQITGLSRQWPGMPIGP